MRTHAHRSRGFRQRALQQGDTASSNGPRSTGRLLFHQRPHTGAQRLFSHRGRQMHGSPPASAIPRSIRCIHCAFTLHVHSDYHEQSALHLQSGRPQPESRTRLQQTAVSTVSVPQLLFCSSKRKRLTPALAGAGALGETQLHLFDTYHINLVQIFTMSKRSKTIPFPPPTRAHTCYGCF